MTDAPIIALLGSLVGAGSSLAVGLALWRLVGRKEKKR